MSKTNSRSTKKQRTDKKLRAELKRVGLSQAEFAQLFQVSTTTVQNWATGKTATPAWVGPALKLFERLPEDEREEMLGVRRLFANSRDRKLHPFARIEEL